MILRVIDVETTGLDPTVDRVCEVAFVDVDVVTRSIASQRLHQYLCNPGRPIPPEASAVHHLTDNDVSACPTLEEHIDYLRSPEQLAIVYVAHNAQFDRAFLHQLPVQWICTKKLAYRIWPNAPAYSNQVLRYWRKLTFDYDLSMALKTLAPHRAAYDAIVTASLLLDELNELDWDIDLALRITEQPALLPRVTFGKHAGLAWADVPTDYLQWLLKQDFDEDTLYTAKHHLNSKG